MKALYEIKMKKKKIKTKTIHRKRDEMMESFLFDTGSINERRYILCVLWECTRIRLTWLFWRRRRKCRLYSAMPNCACAPIPKTTKKKMNWKKTQTTKSWKSVTSEDLNDNHIRMRHVRVKCLYAMRSLVLYHWFDEMRQKKKKKKNEKSPKIRSNNKEWKMHDKVFG